MRQAAKVDANQSDIVTALLNAGCSVQDTSAVGKGFPDLVVGRARRTYLIEVKTETGKLTPAQAWFSAIWQGHFQIARSVDDALRIVGVIR